jgi:two-component system, NarL family, sensor kinase
VTEALTNVARHADAYRCQVRMAAADVLDIEVVDDGTGMNGRPAGVGITAMRERASELGGTLATESPGTGTRVHARLPLVGQS